MVIFVVYFILASVRFSTSLSADDEKGYLFYIHTNHFSPEQSILKRYSLEEKTIEDIFTFPSGMYPSYLCDDNVYISPDNIMFLKFNYPSVFYGIDLKDESVKFYDDEWAYMISPFRFYNTSKQGQDELLCATTRTEYDNMGIFYSSRNLSKPNYYWSSQYTGFGEKDASVDRSSTVFNNYTNMIYAQISKKYDENYYILGFNVLGEWKLETREIVHVKDDMETDLMKSNGKYTGCSLSSLNYDYLSEKYYSIIQTNFSYVYEFGSFDPSTGEFTKTSDIPTNYFWPKSGSTIGEGKYYQYIQESEKNDLLVIGIDLQTGVIDEEIVLADVQKGDFLTNLVYWRV